MSNTLQRFPWTSRETYFDDNQTLIIDVGILVTQLPRNANFFSYLNHVHFFEEIITVRLVGISNL